MRPHLALACLILLGATKPKRPPELPPPLVRMNPPPPAIQVTDAPTWRYGSWAASDMGDFSIASTENEGGSAFGGVCGKDCVWFVNFQTRCTVGHYYPAMVNGPTGSYAIELRCYYLDERWLLTFPMTKESLGMVRKGGEIGFAFPLESGKFGVSRFSLSGAASATLKAIDIAMEKRNQSQEGLRDFTI